MPARMFRIPDENLQQVGRYSFIDTGTIMTEAMPVREKGSTYYLLSYKGAGINALGLLGTYQGVLGFLSEKRQWEIRNTAGNAPHTIFWKVEHYRPGKRIRGVFPVHDTAGAVAKGVGGMGASVIGGAVSSPGTSDLAANIGYVVKGFVEAVKGGETTKSPSQKRPSPSKYSTNEWLIKFYWSDAETGMNKLADGSIDFDDLHTYLTRTFNYLEIQSRLIK